MTADLLRKGLKLNHLRLAAQLGEQASITVAAEALGMSQPAVSRLAAEIARITGSPIYARTGRGIALTESGRLLANRAARIINEIVDAGRDISELQRGLTGHVRIGSVTGPSLEYVLPAIRKVRLAYPDISVHVEVAASDALTAMLSEGRLDFAVCRQPETRLTGEFDETILSVEPVSFVTRTHHPLQNAPAGNILDKMLSHDWVMPPQGAILRTTVERALRAHGHRPPAHVFTTSSFLFTLAMVKQTNAIAPVASAVAASFCSSDEAGLAVLSCKLDIAVETYSMLTRWNQTLTPAANVFHESVLSEHALRGSLVGGVAQAG